jgi:hypothetical protein
VGGGAMLAIDKGLKTLACAIAAFVFDWESDYIFLKVRFAGEIYQWQY